MDFTLGTNVEAHTLIYMQRMAEAPHKINLQEEYALKGRFVTLDDAIAALAQPPLRAWPAYVGGVLLEFANHNFVVLHLVGTKASGRIYGDRAFRDQMRALEETDLVPQINWTFINYKGDPTTVNIDIGAVDPIHDSFYPFIKDGVQPFLEGYFKSKAAVLILAGDPGTGKTSLIRHMIKAHKRRAIVTHDEKIMGSDMFYVDYMTCSRHDLMIIEDADLLLASRESDGNRTMTKLLNTSDGLARLMHKKIVFSTNLANLHKIDAALTRPGRCYDVVHFRALSSDEAYDAAKAAGLSAPASGTHEYTPYYTLSEIFNGKHDTSVATAKIIPAGFPKLGRYG